ncbi:hypothetical protein [Acidocella sp. KAb 2-4]|uniref:hypothetical protein n=1 Tax=Acidocella sp. KAb 2-4 TaxID=2885158 RepID=UPI001D06BD52|nr:hypothetical protein [Acidocella sp. KAb 2-4]MCB5943234.1 hypothetical protein [Acidocella sp. KAb 2-4]
MYGTHSKTARGFEQQMAAFNPAGVMDDWRQRTLRVLRAQERLMQGMAAAARLELRFGQECMVSGFGLLNGGWPEPGHASKHMADDMERLMSVIREVNDELRTSFTEAGKMLSEAEAAPAKGEAAAKPAERRTKIVVEDSAEEKNAKAA